MNQEKINLAAESLYKDFTNRSKFTLMTEDFAPLDIDEAYAVQATYMDLRAVKSGNYAGYKIAYTTEVMRQIRGAKEPVYGRIFKSDVINSPAAVSASSYIHLGVECEIAVIIGDDLNSKNGFIDKDTVFGAVKSIAIAFEIIDMRPSLGITSIPQSIATNISGAGVVIGKSVENWRNLDISGSKCELKINGESVGCGMGADINGHPVEPIAWLANALLSRGKYLKSGDLVITGSMITPTFLQESTDAVLKMANLGSVTLSVD
jgi:2-keto-4-pentenoate hydratase